MIESDLKKVSSGILWEVLEDVSDSSHGILNFYVEYCDLAWGALNWFSSKTGTKLSTANDKHRIGLTNTYNNRSLYKRVKEWIL